MTSFLTFLLTTILIYQSFVNSCEIYHFETEPNKMFVNHVFETMTTLFKELCRNECQLRSQCMSINVRKSQSPGFVECDLNNSSKSAKPENLVTSLGSDYEQMANVDDRNAQLYDQVIWKEALSKRWYRFGRFAFKVFMVGKTWLDARTDCHSFGGDLASVSSGREHQFLTTVKDQLTPKGNRTKPTAHWPLQYPNESVSLTPDAGTLTYNVTQGHKGLRFRGGRQIASVPAVNVDRNFAVALWVNFANPQSGSFINIFSITGESGVILNFFLHEPHHEVTCVLKNTDNTDIIRSKQVKVPFNEWIHFAFTWSFKSDSTSFAFFVNGKNKDFKTTHKAFNSSSLKNTKHFHLGQAIKYWEEGSQNSMNGYIRDLMIYNEEVPDETEIEEMTSIRVWMGLTRSANSSFTSWINGVHLTSYSSSMIAKYLNTTFPEKRCVAMDADGAMIAITCDSTLLFACRKQIT